MAIFFFEENVKSGLKNRRKLKSFIEQKINDSLVVKQIAINIIFCTDEELLEKNIEYLQHHTFTDIITFDLSNREDELQSELYISIDRVRDNANTFNVPYIQELHRVIFHGVLHLLGYGDKKKDEIIEMRRQEQLLITEYGY